MGEKASIRQDKQRRITGGTQREGVETLSKSIKAHYIGQVSERNRLQTIV